MLRFIIPALLLGVFTPYFAKWLLFNGWIPELPTFLFETTWLVTFITTVIFVYLYRWNRPEVFVQLFLLSMVVKLAAALGYTLYMVAEDPSNAVANTLYFLALYAVFTALETGLLYRKISRSPSR